MNAYLDNSRINTHRNSLTHTGDGLISFICAIVAFFTSAVAIKVEKTVLSAACFIAFFGVIGSMENESLGILGGIALSAALIFVEYLILRSLSVQKADKK